MNTIKNVLLAIYVFLALTCQGHVLGDTTTTKQDIIAPKFSQWQVTMVNGLSTQETLFIHCKSKEDDLGEQYLSVEDRFSWNFGENMIHTTLFWCYISKDDGYVNVNVFWDDVILFHRCGWKNCVWTAKRDGVYLRNFATGEDVLSKTWEVGW
ncbi:unnamed protein product [Cochlearia groenlandica]